MPDGRARHSSAPATTATMSAAAATMGTRERGGGVRAEAAGGGRFGEEGTRL
jgi:hypothetical protein